MISSSEKLFVLVQVWFRRNNRVFPNSISSQKQQRNDIIYVKCWTKKAQISKIKGLHLSEMMDVMKDREVWRLNLELLPPQPSKKSGQEEWRKKKISGKFFGTFWLSSTKKYSRLLSLTKQGWHQCKNLVWMNPNPILRYYSSLFFASNLLHLTWKHFLVQYKSHLIKTRDRRPFRKTANFKKISTGTAIFMIETAWEKGHLRMHFPNMAWLSHVRRFHQIRASFRNCCSLLKPILSKTQETLVRYSAESLPLP